MKRIIYPMLLATAFVATACTTNQETDIVTPVDPNGKTAISFSVEEQNRALTRAGFTANTKIAMRIKSEATNQTPRYTRTVASAAAAASGTDYSSITIDEAYVRYWDDAYGRAANLSVYAIAVPNTDNVTNDGNSLEQKLTAGTGTWFTETSENEKVSWKVTTTTQTSTTLTNEDLTYSNNISESGTGGVYQYNFTDNKYPEGINNLSNGRMQFRLQTATVTDGPGKFDKGHLKFTHALSRITVNLKKGDGYPTTGAFTFATGTNVKILDVPTSGNLNLSDGTWGDVQRSDINLMYLQTNAETGYDYTLMAQMLPGYTFTDGSNTNVLEFTIDDNKYFVTQDMMLDALNSGKNSSENSLTMAQGNNYVFTITVGKSKIINVTATLEKWVDVKANNQNMDNSHISLDLFTSTGTASTNFDLYRLNDESSNINTGASTAKNWGGNYTDKATLTQSNNVWTTNWFFENNKAFYHFRTVSTNTNIKGTSDNTDDYFEITSGDQAGHDYHWGAPFVKGATIACDKTNGYSAIISPAIGATNSTISMTELHMMSNINVVLRTTTTSNAVKLEDASNNQCVVTLTYFYKDGTVNMGNGLVKTTGNLDNGTNGVFSAPEKGTKSVTVESTEYIETNPFTFAVVPQTLTRTEGTNLYVGITIKTPDNNQYYVVEKLSDIIATANGGNQNQTASNKIDFWYPNHNYTYTFTITKAGISNVTCTVENWKQVTAENQNISLED